MKWDITEGVSSFKYLESCFSNDGGPQKDLKMSVSEGQINF